MRFRTRLSAAVLVMGLGLYAADRVLPWFSEKSDLSVFMGAVCLMALVIVVPTVIGKILGLGGKR